MSNSSLVSYTKISPNKNTPRNHKIDTITIHCMAGQLSIESCGSIFASSSRQASSNYGVGPDGRIGMYVEEKDRSWASSNAANDHRAVTIEVASDSTAPYAVKDAAYQATIKLVADICKRNGIKKLVWSTDKSTRINHSNGSNMTVHRDFANKACPGDYLYNHMGDIAAKVNAILGSGSSTASSAPASTTAATTTTNTTTVVPGSGDIVKIIDKTGMNVRKGPGINYDKTGDVCKYNVQYTIVAYSGTWGKLKSGAGWINCDSKYVQKVKAGTTTTVNTTTAATSTVAVSKPATTQSGKPVYTVGKNYTLQDEMKVRKGPGTNYAAKKYSELTANAKKFDKDRDGALDKGTTVTCQEIRNVNGNIWMRVPSGWIAAYINGTTYIK